MPLSEFDIIAHFFRDGFPRREDVVQGVGDDGAVLQPSPGQQLVLACDTLVAGQHFFPDTDPAALAHKALAVNLSDLAAMGAEPAWFTLALTLPEADSDWLQHFSTGLATLAREFHIALVGGDTTRGPLSLTLTVVGFVPAGEALTRAGARDGDAIVVTGPLGGAALGLAVLQRHHEAGAAEREALLACLHRPRPRVAAGLALRGHVHAAIDISDGLCGDLGHILEASGVGASLDVDAIPGHPALAQVLPRRETRYDYILAGGEDYELCLCVAPAEVETVCALLRKAECSPAVIGYIEAQAGLRLRDAAGKCVTVPTPSFQHFR